MIVTPGNWKEFPGVFCVDTLNREVVLCIYVQKNTSQNVKICVVLKQSA